MPVPCGISETFRENRCLLNFVFVTKTTLGLAFSNIAVLFFSSFVNGSSMGLKDFFPSLMLLLGCTAGIVLSYFV